MHPTPFQDRHDAGRRLAAALAHHAGEAGALVLALPRGGVPVGAEVAAALGLPLDILVVRKLGVPGHEEYAMGAIAGGGVKVLHEPVLQMLRIPAVAVARVVAREQEELARRERAYRGDRPLPVLGARTVLLVDDGLATGASMEAALAVVQRQHPARVVVAVPVAPAETLARLRDLADEVVCVLTPEPFDAVGSWYRDFPQTSDDEVRTLLGAAPRC
ncbi:MAG TPA: phosphoribosyltransferase family protein [Gemmatimonadaceae bacterium]